MKFHLTSLALAAFLGAATAGKDKRTFAVLHFNNKQLVAGRMDPIVSPNAVSGHVHNVLGGSNFALGSTGEELMKSNCTNAKIKGDNSNYWYPKLYFKDPKTGELEDVEIFYTNVYYFFEPTNDDITAFPVGLSMVSGDPNLRTPPATGGETNLDPSKGPVNAIKWTCPRKNENVLAWPANSNGLMAGIGDPNNKGEGVGFPDVTCDGFASPLRADIHFPSCYNPKAGLTNFKENMAWPTDAGNGKSDCPKGYIHVPHLFFEAYWDTLKFKGRWEEGQGKQPFVLANGDPTGYSLHADFMAGWNTGLLQHIIDTCDAGTSGMDKCPGLFYGVNNDDCSIDCPINEKIVGTLDKLPGKNDITGWQYGNGGNPPSGGTNPPTQSGSQSVAQPSTGPSSSSAGNGAGNNGPSASGSTQASQPAVSQPAVSQTSGDEPTGQQPTNTDQATVPTGKPAPSSNQGSLPSQPAGSGKCTRKTKTVSQYVTVTTTISVPSPQASEKPNGPVGDYQYAGCYKDTRDRVLTGKIRVNLGAVSNTNCVEYCKKAGFSMAGTEYGGQCYCGNELVGSQKVADSACATACEGDKSQTCGGGWALTIYSKDGKATLKDTKARRHAHEHVRRANHRG